MNILLYENTCVCCKSVWQTLLKVELRLSHLFKTLLFYLKMLGLVCIFLTYFSTWFIISIFWILDDTQYKIIEIFLVAFSVLECHFSSSKTETSSIYHIFVSVIYSFTQYLHYLIFLIYYFHSFLQMFQMFA